MATDRYRFEPLGPTHDRAAFVSGSDALDRYLRQQAGQEARKKVAAVVVLHDVIANAIVGYYTLSMSAITSSELPPDIVKRMPKYAELPVALLGRLAVSEAYQDQGFGKRLLLDALKRSLAMSDRVAAMAVVVVAKNDAARGFYERFGFRRYMTDDLRLFLPMGTIAKL